MEEWRRSNPDIVVYLPKEDGRADTDNEHFLVFVAPESGDLLALWTQSSCEGRGDNHLALARSQDGVSWSEPATIAGAVAGTDSLQASWGFPVVSKQGRVYVFYTRETPVVDNNRQGSGAMGCLVSDDDGHSWTPGQDMTMPRNRFDHADPSIPGNWIVWQKPVRDANGRWLAGYTQCTSQSRLEKTYKGWVNQDSRCAFLRFENIDEAPDPADVEITWLPTDREGLEVTNPVYPEMSVAQEPSVALLPDGRLFTVMRTMTGYIWYAVSADDGETWAEPEAMRYADHGEPVPHPMSPCPLYRLEDGRYLLIYHNNNGKHGKYDQFELEWKCNHANFLRNPTYFAVGHFEPEAHQPLRFDAPVQLLDTDGLPIGPKGTAEIGTYPSLTERDGQRILWYPDRKYYLLGRYLTDDILAGGGRG